MNIISKVEAYRLRTELKKVFKLSNNNFESLVILLTHSNMLIDCAYAHNNKYSKSLVSNHCINVLESRTVYNLEPSEAVENILTSDLGISPIGGSVFSCDLDVSPIGESYFLCDFMVSPNGESCFSCDLELSPIGETYFSQEIKGPPNGGFSRTGICKIIVNY